MKETIKKAKHQRSDEAVNLITASASGDAAIADARLIGVCGKHDLSFCKSLHLDMRFGNSKSFETVTASSSQFAVAINFFFILTPAFLAFSFQGFPLLVRETEAKKRAGNKERKQKERAKKR
jgi:hypothetical protein